MGGVFGCMARPLPRSRMSAWTLYGALFRLLLPIGSIAILYLIDEESPRVVDFVRTAHRYPLPYVIDTAPCSTDIAAVGCRRARCGCRKPGRPRQRISRPSCPRGFARLRWSS